DHGDARDVVEVADDAVELARDIVAEGGSDFDVMSGDVEIHDRSWRRRENQIVLRWLTGGMFRDSRYLAIVRRATTMPCSPSSSVMRESERGFFLSSASISWRISARMAVDEAAPPLSVATWLPKKYFSSNTPRGVAMYFWA